MAQAAVSIHKHNVFAGSIIPVLLEKSIDTIIAILSAMKTGAAYVPLSPGNPLLAIPSLSMKLWAKFVITQSFLSEFSLPIDGIVPFFIDCGDWTSKQLGQPTDVSVTPHHLAYFIYTSESAPIAKRFKSPYRAASAAIRSMIEVEGRHSGHWRNLQSADYVFDVSVD